MNIYQVLSFRNFRGADEGSSGNRSQRILGSVSIGMAVAIYAFGGSQLAWAEELYSRDKHHSKFQEGLQHTGELRWNEAVRSFDAVVRENPQSPLALGNKAFCLSKLGDDEGAIRDLTKAIAINPQGIHYLMRAEIYRRNGLTDAALEDIYQVTDHNFSHGNDLQKARGIVARAYRVRGEILQEQGNTREAHAAFDESKRLLQMDGRW